MAALPQIAPTDPTLDAIASAIENVNNLQRPRPYLGMSAIGMECEHFLWLNFRWAGPAGGGFDAEALCNLEDGHRAEDQMAARLRMVPGVKLHTVDPGTGQQFGFQGLGGHFRGHIDGAIVGILQAPKTWHTWEHKASKEGPVKLAKLKAMLGEKQALKAWNPTYYAQAVLYMHYGELSRHYLTCSSPGGRMPWTSVRTNANDDDAALYIAKAQRVIFSPEPLAKVSEDAAFWKCKSCPMSRQCHGTALPAASCRTCLHATPEPDGDGRWSCAKWGADIPLDAQREGCGHHLYIPALLSRWGAVDDASEPEGWVAYRAPDGYTFRNGPWGLASFTSKELAASTPALLRDAQFQAIRTQYAGVITDEQVAA